MHHKVSPSFLDLILLRNYVHNTSNMFSKELIKLLTNYFKETYNLDISDEDAQIKLYGLGNIYGSAKDMLEEYYALDKESTEVTIQ